MALIRPIPHEPVFETLPTVAKHRPQAVSMESLQATRQEQAIPCCSRYLLAKWVARLIRCQRPIYSINHIIYYI